MSDDLGRWEAITVAEVARLFRDAVFPWWIAGGHAIELAVGQELREHDDLDVLVLRRDQAVVREYLAGWDLHVADPPGAGRLRPWRSGEYLEQPLNSVWCRRTPSEPWVVELLLDEAEGGSWVSRRDSCVRLPIDRLGGLTPEGVPYLRPEVQLFYKAKVPRPKDEFDFEAVLPLLDSNQRAWLSDALSLRAPHHPWRGRL